MQNTNQQSCAQAQAEAAERLEKGNLQAALFAAQNPGKELTGPFSSIRVIPAVLPILSPASLEMFSSYVKDAPN